ncbi:MAG: DNA alkylation repair protein [Clostridium sp.]|nr:DNA alkylation repair protein [Acetatifactor muris]MCM1526571.1 DNA alkylation repair protein [Bacteroides sp.]MCM1562303.1 DNA alkylation repair protein [Clostridium sp.]
MTTEFIREQLFALQDTEYKAFHAKLIPTVDPERIIGVRTPELRKLAKKLWKTGETAEFMAELPHLYYEENNLHVFWIEQIRDCEECIAALDTFLPHVDNWATCDMTAPKVLGRHKERLIGAIRVWIASEHTYAIRFGMGMLMRHFLDEDFDAEYPDMVAEFSSEEYYVNMMRAWYFATALAKQYDAVIPYIREQRLDVWTHNRTIQKAVESYRITPEQKNYLRSLRRG